MAVSSGVRKAVASCTRNSAAVARSTMDWALGEALSRSCPILAYIYTRSSRMDSAT